MKSKQTEEHPPVPLLLRLEHKMGATPRQTAAVLRVAYNGSYAPWRSGKTPLPRYVEQSVTAHLLLSKTTLEKMLKAVHQTQE